VSRLDPPPPPADNGRAMATAAQTLAAFAHGLRLEAIPAAVRENVALRVLDTVGIALAASGEAFAAPVLGLVEGWGSGGDSTVLGSKLRAAPPLAILANGSLAHGLDFDDTHPLAICHASAVVVPPALALGESLGLGGGEALAAMVAGYEALVRLGAAAPGEFHARGWHATAVCGTFAAALVAGRCLGLSPAELTAALGIAGSLASGVLEHLEDGSWVKRLHPGWAGHAGAVAAALARGGFTGPATILEGRFGLYRAFLGRDVDPAALTEGLGQRWETLRVAFKPYPCCHLSHAYMDCAARLRREHGLSPEAIVEVECLVPEGEVPIVCEPLAAKRRPRTPYDAQFSLPYSVAAALVEEVGVDTFSAGRILDGRLLALAARVGYRVDPASPFPRSFPGRLRVRLADGRVLEAAAPFNRGSAENPLSREEIFAKFRANASRALPPARVERLEEGLLDFERAADLRALLALAVLP
jgi:2-methylcitrate dehydratase PrpD